MRLNNPTASVKEKPIIAKVNKSDLREGFLAVALTKLPNTIPAPIAAPVNPIVAIPAPINFDACNILINPYTKGGVVWITN